MVHCTEVIKFTEAHPGRSAKAPWVAGFAQQARALVTKLLDSRFRDAVAGDHSTQNRAPGTNGAEAGEHGSATSSSMTPGARGVLGWTQQVPSNPSSSSPERHLPPLLPPSSPPAAPPRNDENRIRIRWRGHGNGPAASPYKRTAATAIVNEIQGILSRSSLPGLASVQVAGAQVLRSGDLDVPGAHEEAWLRALPKGEHAQITNHQYAVLVHHVPITYLPSQSAVERLQEKILHCNPALRGPILHVGWCGNDAAARQSKQISSLVVSFRDAQSANHAIRNRIFLDGTPLRTELFDPLCRLLQCTRCLNYGHAQPVCTAERVTCLYCANAHDKKFCKVKGVPSQHRCAVCHGPHQADSKQCPVRQHEHRLSHARLRNRPQFFASPPQPADPAPLQPPAPPHSTASTGPSGPEKPETIGTPLPHPEDTRQLAGQPLSPVDATKTTCSPAKAPIHPIIDVSRHPLLRLQPSHSMQTRSRSTSPRRPQQAITAPAPAAEPAPSPQQLPTYDTNFYIPVPTPPQSDGTDTGTSTPKQTVISASPPPSLLSNPARRVPGLSSRTSNTSSLSALSQTPSLPSDLTWEVPGLPAKRKRGHPRSRSGHCRPAPSAQSTPDPLDTPVTPIAAPKRHKISTKTYDTEDDCTTQA
ncbi:uncharacterized protein NFIA_043600 [Aspergillus fischeri NRRL 181]|uniref:Uncharacterized protein n=1 Tax=Neosartorya fischeri (strain ATCC 1020 / DSM 3700 / CBS 544.65 / FGSC A1164 / JCM 1740 / NRRL 181 / WB 181) TaxID=331117 RepID=A1CUW5_NEOFI|nr:uncharacterized protein NFIA_043600 [Aspergillus fischeri NRRL 181]EAW25542.1 hypothetical protein NFIA_043600 [Aspergillus fischeri NRRL 181]